ncbi:hypothetical protein ABZ342_32040 [Amycolatopsis sp. NPDC005961]|uniref:hypothetical protein n=1 Tax=Amycolatopsis sp. NPDC005961 TaxID=3156720 RepID=UPI0033E7E159
MRIIAFAAALVSAWLTWGASSLHQKDPAHYGLILPLALAVVAVMFLFAGVVSKTKSDAKARR